MFGSAFDNCINIDDLRRLARKRLPTMIYDFLVGGADDEDTTQRNTAAFRNYELLPDTLVDVSNLDPGTTILGRKVPLPLLLSPTGGTKAFHHQGELACARAASRAGVFYIMSTMANSTIEEVATHCPGPKIFQLYVFRDRGVTHALLDRSRAAGFDATCLTVDTTTGGNRERDVRHRMRLPYKPSLAGLIAIASRPAWAFNTLTKVKFETVNFDNVIQTERRDPKATMHFVNTQFDRAVTWKDVAMVADRCPGPLILKGILSATDAKKAVDSGATAIMVSNHGGRQMDAVPAPIDLIAEIRDAVGDRLEIILDGGVRRGSHVIKALARGANACSIGRPYLFGLAAGGEAGVDKALAILRAEIERGMTLMGLPDVPSIEPRHVRPRMHGGR